MQNKPLADRMRPVKFDDYIGQEHLVGKDSALRKMIEKGKLPSMILWGPPGVGKTSLAKLICNLTKSPFYTLSAINSGVKDVRDVIEKSKKSNLFSSGGKAILFIDEIHRFSKSQQDSLLGAVEDGTVCLIGATTENPSFEVISPLLSRCQTYILKSLGVNELKKLTHKALENDSELQKKNITIKEYDAMFRFSGGDARKLFNIIELIANSSESKDIEITNELIVNKLHENIAIYDKSGEQHYDIISAFIKSVRGSDPDAALYWLARMLQGGEDIKFIARRLIILAAEDIGLANPNALLIANSCFEAINNIGMPEARIILSECCIYLACSPKSNSAYKAINSAIDMAKQTGGLSVPLHLRNAPTKLMKELNYGKDYKYSHSYENHFVNQQYLPEEIKDEKFYKPANNKREKEITDFLSNLKKIQNSK